ncbi:MAG TPA: PAS domain S-box protein [Rectinemataceae bacterium]|nr:PAS domain S-box protein [Rectinemataceae bacterium]
MGVSGQKRILLVEDEALIGMAQKLALEKYGYQVTTALNAEAAIGMCLGNEAPDLVLMDIDLGKGLDGSGAAKAILEKKQIPIVFLSSHTERETVEKTETITSYGYVVKNSGIIILDASIKMAFRLFEANKKLAKSEHRYGSLFSSMTEGFAIHELVYDESGRPVDYRFLDVNPAFERLTGLSKEAIVGRRQREVIPDEDPFWFETYSRVVLTGEPVVLEHSSPALGRHYEVFAYRTEPNCFAVIFSDVSKRKAIEDALRESEERFRGIVENSEAGYFFIDSEGIYRDINAAWLKLHGFERREEIIGRHFSSTQVDVDLAGSAEIVAHLLAGGTVPSGEFSRRRRDGSTGWHLFSSRPVRGGGKVIGLEGFLFDISERKKTEESLRESEHLFKSLYSNMLNGFAYCRMYYDEDGDPVDFGYLAVNEAFEAQTGLKDVVGRRISEIVPGMRESDPRLFVIYGRVARTGVAERFEMFLESLGAWFLVSVFSPKPEHFIAIFDVTTRRKKTEESLDEISRRFRSLAANVPGYLAYLDAKTLRYEYVNDTYSKAYARSAESIVGSTVPEVIGREKYEYALPYFEEARAGRSASYENSFDFATGRRWLRLNYSPVFDPMGIVVSIAVLGYDITESRRQEEAVRSLLKEKELVLREVHHRIKNNMGTIGSLLELQADSTADPGAKVALTEASRRVRSMFLLYDRIYRSEAPGMVRAQDYLPLLIDEILAELPRIPGLVVDKRIEDLVLDPGTAQPLGIILNELLTNSMKYAFRGRVEGRIAIELGLREGRSRLLVEDDGPGFPPGVSFGRSTGFGLVLVDALAKQLGGRLEVDGTRGLRVSLEFGD